MARHFAYDPTFESLIHPCRGEFFAGWQPATTASLCAELSRLAYCRGNAVEEALSKIDFELVLEVGEAGGKGTFAFLAKSHDLAVLAFRGTQPGDPNDFLTDIQVLPVPWSEGGLVHEGFGDALARVWPDLATPLGELAVPIIFTGHSLGAALATLAASRMSPQKLITFGSPRVGDGDFGRILSGRVEAERYVNCCDIVCQLPPPLPFQHFGRLHYLDRRGDLQVEPSGWTMTQDQLVGHADYVQEHLWQSGAVPTRSLADHAPINYVSALARSA